MLALLHYVFGVVLTFFSIYGYGNFILKDKDPFLTLLIGYLFLGTVSFFLHFFLPINIFISSFVIFIGLILFFLFKKKINLLPYTLIIIIFSLLLIGKSDHPIDSNLYHHSYVSYLQTEKIVLGISNIHSRFGHISFLQFVQALYSNKIFTVYSLSSINILFYSIFLIFLLKVIFYEKKNNLTLVITILISSFLLIKLARYREYGNDLIPFLISNFFLIKIVDTFSKFKNVNSLILYLPIYVFLMLTHKITYLFSSLIFLGFINKETLKIYLYERKNIIIILISILITIAWLVKNLLETSCLIYPVIQTCFSDLPWYSSGASNPESALINAEAWSKGWIDKPKNMNLNMIEFSQSFNWVGVWFSNHFIKIIEIISPLIATILLIKIINIRNKINAKKLSLQNVNFKKFLIKILILNLVGLIFWFLNAPIFRYGSFYIVTTIIFIFIILDFKSINAESLNLKKLKYIFILFIIIFTYKNIDRFIKSDNPFFSKTRPPVNEYNVVYNNKIKIIKPKKQLGLCYYPVNICSHWKMDNLEIDTIGNYFLIKN